MLTALVLTLGLAADPTMMTLARGPASAIDEAQQVVARTEAEWDALWAEHAGREPRPEVDFSTDMVAAVFLGTRPTAGFGAEILGARTDGDTLVIEWVERRPARGELVGQILTSPFHIVTLPRHAGPVRFQKQ